MDNTMELDFISYTFFALIVIVFLAAAIKILREYQRGVVFTLGRFTGADHSYSVHPADGTG
jgi:regulator of protease activity HflC (stomatin/prohibitin superfamily)